MTNDELVRIWAQRYLDSHGVKYPEDGVFSVSDHSTVEGGCETCGYGGSTYYTLEISVVRPNTYRGSVYHTADIGFLDLLRDLQELKEELDSSEESYNGNELGD